MGRLIPAHAGKTHPSVYADQVPWAHPRSRGENVVRVNVLDGCRGSSPLTRGKRKGGACRMVQCGLIPAHAGKTAGAGESAR